MNKERNRIIAQNVVPAILANACVFLFSVVDGIFVGNGAGIQALGAVNLWFAMPITELIVAVFVVSRMVRYTKQLPAG